MTATDEIKALHIASPDAKVLSVSADLLERYRMEIVANQRFTPHAPIYDTAMYKNVKVIAAYRDSQQR